MKPFIPIEKQSKKVRREYHKRQRRTWGAISPVTRRPPDPRAYQRKRIHNGEADEPTLVDFLSSRFTMVYILSALVHSIFIAF